MGNKRDELWERLGIADISAIPDLTRERLYAAREEIQATPAGAPLRPDAFWDALPIDAKHPGEIMRVMSAWARANEADYRRLMAE